MSSNILDPVQGQSALGLCADVVEELSSSGQVATWEDVLTSEPTIISPKSIQTQSKKLSNLLPLFCIGCVLSLLHGDTLKHRNAPISLKQLMDDRKILCKMSFPNCLYHFY